MAEKKKSVRWFFVILLLVFSAIAISSQLIEAEQIPPVYIVKKGDTLWNISRRYFEDPFFWPNLWQKNKYIKDPQWIYPGQPLLLKEKKIVPPNLEREHRARVVKLPKPQPTSEPPLTPPLSTPENIACRDLIDSCGYILPEKEYFAKEKQEKWGAIIDAKESKMSYSYPDLVYINKGKEQVSPGEMFTVFRSDDMVIHPQTDQKLGYLIQILGIIKVSYKIMSTYFR